MKGGEKKKKQASYWIPLEFDGASIAAAGDVTPRYSHEVYCYYGKPIGANLFELNLMNTRIHFAVHFYGPPQESSTTVQYRLSALSVLDFSDSSLVPL